MKICRGKGNHRTFTAKITAKRKSPLFSLYVLGSLFIYKTNMVSGKNLIPNNEPYCHFQYAGKRLGLPPFKSYCLSAIADSIPHPIRIHLKSTTVTITVCLITLNQLCNNWETLSPYPLAEFHQILLLFPWEVVRI